MNERSSTPKSFFETMSPAQTFVAGIIGGVLVLCTIGFFILLGIMLSSDGISLAKADAKEDTPTAIQQPTQPSQPTQPANINMPPVTDADHIRGNKDAKITLVEYSDYECPFCSRFHPTMQQVMDEYDGEVAWVYRHFPLESIHPNARRLANAAECASEQGKFWEMTDKIFAASGKATNDQLAQFAGDLGLDVSQFSSCLDAQKYNNEISKDLASAASAQCGGTPCTLLVDENGDVTPIQGGAVPFTQLKAVLDPLVK